MSILLNNIDGLQTYTLGDTVELLFKTDATTALAIGSTMNVDILDIFENVILTVVASKISDLYIAEFIIPFDLGAKYNTGLQVENGDIDFFYLKDVWNLDINTKMSFEFKVLRKLESPTEDNNVIQIFIDGIEGADGSKLPKNMLAFTTLLNPFYASVVSVKDVYRDLLSNYDNFTVARSIINISKIVDYHMKPLMIHREASFNLARSNYVKLKSAWTLLLSVIQINQEEKKLDSFSISKTTAGPKAVLDQIENEINKLSLFIWAGGKDTPFISNTFEKGLYDPNRPNLSRATLDSTGNFPWVNTSTKSSIMMIDGSGVEIRGERSITYPYMRNRMSGAVDQGDAGYLSGI